MSETDLLKSEEVASMFRVDPRTVRRWGSTGRITVIRLSPRCLRYPAASVQALMTNGLDGGASSTKELVSR